MKQKSLRQLAQELGVSPSYLSQVKHGKRPASEKVLSILGSNVNKIKQNHKANHEGIIKQVKQTPKAKQVGNIKQKVKQSVKQNIPIAIKQPSSQTIRQGLQANSGGINGVPGGTRTHDPLLRRQLLYPAELQGHHAKYCSTSFSTQATIPVNQGFITLVSSSTQ